MPLPSPPLIHSLFYTHSLSLSLTYTLTLSLTQTHSPTPHTYTLTLTPPNTLSHTHTHTHTVHRGAVRRGHRRPRSKYGVKSAARIPNVRKQRWVRTDNTHAYAPTCVFSKTSYFFLCGLLKRISYRSKAFLCFVVQATRSSLDSPHIMSLPPHLSSLNITSHLFPHIFGLQYLLLSRVADIYLILNSLHSFLHSFLPSFFPFLLQMMMTKEHSALVSAWTR